MFRISLREILIVVALANVAIASLKYANEFWLLLVAALTMIVLFVVLIVAVVDRGPGQAFAIGCALVMSCYGVIVMNGATTSNSGTTQNLELDQWSGRLPTTRILRYVHMALDKSQWVKSNTSQVIPGYPANPRGVGFGGSGGAVLREVPPREFFMPIGHCWWSLILGYAGGHLARFVYWRRMRERPSLAAESS